MILRPAHPADAASLAALSIEVWLGTYLKQGINEGFARYVLSEFTTSRFETQIVESYLVVADGTDGIEGFVQIKGQCPAPNGIACDTEIQKLYVRPNRHRHGIGRALLGAALNHCIQMGVDSVWLATNSENMPAIGFYLAQGFAIAGTTAFRLGDQAYPNTVFLRDLSASAGP